MNRYSVSFMCEAYAQENGSLFFRRPKAAYNLYRDILEGGLEDGENVYLSYDGDIVLSGINKPKSKAKEYESLRNYVYKKTRGKGIRYDSKDVYFVGDIHGDFNKALTITKDLENALVVFCGDCGFGFSNPTKIRNFIRTMATPFLEKRNLNFVFIRGNHDNPDYFSGGRYNDRFRLVADGTALFVGDKNIFCVGGGVSVDRSLRTHGVDYWLGEEVAFIKPPYSKKRWILATHTTDDVIRSVLPMPEFLKYYMKIDKSLERELQRESAVMSNIKNAVNPIFHVCGHFHVSLTIPGEFTTRVLNCNEVYKLDIHDL